MFKLIIYLLLIYISFIFLDIKKEKNLKNIILSKSLLSLTIFSFMVDCFIRFSSAIKLRLNNFDLLAKQYQKPLIFIDSSKLITGLYIVIIFFAVLSVFLRTKENKNTITLVTFISFLVTFLIYCFCPLLLVCYIYTFAPQILGLFLIIPLIKELRLKKRKNNNIKAGKFRFVICIITLVLVLLNILGSIFWLIFGEKITKFLIQLNQSKSI